MRPAIFLDRDGVINENRADHVMAWEQFAPVPGALAGLRKLTALDLPIIVITNQAVVGRGDLPEEALAALHGNMCRLIERHGGHITAVYACPHRPEDRCACRKPRPGLFVRAARDHDLDLASSYFIGDALTDITAGQAAGCTTVLVRTGRGLAQMFSPHAQPYSGFYVAQNLPHAARFIARELARKQGRQRRFMDLRMGFYDVQFI